MAKRSKRKMGEEAAPFARGKGRKRKEKTFTFLNL
jgi:hypothetical protein